MRSERKPKSQPFSIRLGEAADLLVRDEGRRTGRSRSAIVEELAEEAAKMRLFPGIAFRDQPRRAWVIGTGLDVWEVIDMLRSFAGDERAIVDAYANLTERHLHLATAYAKRFPAEIDEILERQHLPLDELLKLYPFIQVVEVE
jgi:uncharacterized protein (DUF433 family)